MNQYQIPPKEEICVQFGVSIFPSPWEPTLSSRLKWG